MKAKLFFLFCLISLCASAGNYEVSSPNGKVKVTITTDEGVKWSVDYDGRQVLLPSAIDIRLSRVGRRMVSARLARWPDMLSMAVS